MTELPTPKPVGDVVASETAPAEQDPAAATDAGTPPLDEARLNAFVREMRTNQRLGVGVGAGLVAAIVGAAAWAGVTLATDYQIGWMAIGVGALTGAAVRFAGRGIDPVFGIAGAVLALLGCLGGNVAVIYVVLADLLAAEGYTGLVPFDLLFTFMVDFTEPIDLLFYGLAMWAGYRLSFRNITDAEFAELAAQPQPQQPAA